jgi:hypothetical protein
MNRYLVTIEGAGWQDVEELELPAIPAEDDLIETKYGTCLVVRAEPSPSNEQYDGKIACRVPG